MLTINGVKLIKPVDLHKFDYTGSSNCKKRFVLHYGHCSKGFVTTITKAVRAAQRPGSAVHLICDRFILF